MNLLKPLLKLKQFLAGQTTPVKRKRAVKAKGKKNSPPKKPAVKKTKRVSGKAQKVRSAKQVNSKKQNEGILTAEITHYFPKVHAAVLKVLKPVKIADPIHIRGHLTNFKMTIKSMQINHIPIDSARKGEEIGLEVAQEVKEGDRVYLIR